MREPTPTTKYNQNSIHENVQTIDDCGNEKRVHMYDRLREPEKLERGEPAELELDKETAADANNRYPTANTGRKYKEITANKTGQPEINENMPGWPGHHARINNNKPDQSQKTA